MLRPLAAFAAFLVAGAPVLAQPSIGPEVLVVNGPANGITCGEVSLSTVTQNTFHVVAVSNAGQTQSGAQVMVAAMSKDGGHTWTWDKIPVPDGCPTDFEGDPTTVALPWNGDMLAGGVAGSIDESQTVRHYRMFADRKALSCLCFNTPSIVVTPDPDCQGYRDRGGFAAGPRPGGTGNDVYSIHRQPPSLGAGLFFSRSTDGGQTWGSETQVLLDDDSPLDLQHHFPIVVPAGESPGRIFDCGAFLRTQAFAFYSDQEGAAQSWHYSGPADPFLGPGFWRYGSGGNPPQIGDTQDVVAPTNVFFCTKPAAAVSPDGSTVAVVFVGREFNTYDNLDLFVALSFNGGRTFNPENTYRLQDSQLFAPGEDPATTHQIQPSIRFDGNGALCLAYINIRNPSSVVPPACTVRYAMFTDLGHLPHHADFVQDVSPVFPATQACPIGKAPNDYLQLAGEGCIQYIGYSRALPDGSAGGAGSMYCVRVVTNYCGRADANGDTVVAADDPSAYLLHVANGSLAADTNMDGVWTVQDFLDFVDAYTQAGPH